VSAYKSGVLLRFHWSAPRNYKNLFIPARGFMQAKNPMARGAPRMIGWYRWAYQWVYM